jgi:hypothetical protein
MSVLLAASQQLISALINWANETAFGTGFILSEYRKAIPEPKRRKRNF